MYCIETHLHTKEVSKCSHLWAWEQAEAYHRAGYNAVVVTDHYNMDTWNYLGVDPRTETNVLPKFLEGFHRMEEACAPFGIRVYMGAELRFYENDNDYLYYGFDPDLLRRPHEIMELGIVRFSREILPQSGLLIQAHPCREGCVPVAPMLLHGMEVFNASPRHMHHNQNDVTRAIAEREGAGFIRTTGSDCHRPEDVGRAGIRSETLPEDGFGFADLLRSGKYDLIIPEDTVGQK